MVSQFVSDIFPSPKAIKREVDLAFKLAVEAGNDGSPRVITKKCSELRLKFSQSIILVVSFLNGVVDTSNCFGKRIERISNFGSKL